ncbi:hypothetical protein [Priestia aryabhattai]|uniref:hypothetical protein n=1 Tax=Priestia aryabhattai TaxID=412384 RepID=UPI002E1A7C6D|nr:hypothetical protein [Priestia aryabhattai]
MEKLMRIFDDRRATKKDKFEEELWNKPDLKILVVVTQISGTDIKEVITTTTGAKEKANYILESYDKDLKMKSNSNVQIIDYIIS